jgi:hypothetical protein
MAEKNIGGDESAGTILQQNKITASKVVISDLPKLNGSTHSTLSNTQDRPIIKQQSNPTNTRESYKNGACK